MATVASWTADKPSLNPGDTATATVAFNLAAAKPAETYTLDLYEGNVKRGSIIENLLPVPAEPAPDVTVQTTVQPAGWYVIGSGSSRITLTKTGGQTFTLRDS